ncbi:MAG: cation:proton antiporter [Betaproteobacteria bacterium]|nr:cation:proton antiporter [Betaproteobacteria bacterium]
MGDLLGHVWPPQFSQAILFGVLLLAGLLAGEAVRRFLALPRIVGYALAGVALGPRVSGLLGVEVLQAARVFVDLSIGLIVFELGFRLDFDWLKRNRWLFATALAESLFSFVAIYAALRYFDFRPLIAAAAAAIGTATSPAVVMMVAREQRAEGQVTERMLLFTALNCMIGYLLLTLILPWVHLEHQTDWMEALWRPLYLLVGSALAGYLASFALLRLAAWIGKREDAQFVLLVAMIVLVVGTARALDLSVMVAVVVFGLLAHNLDARRALLPLRIGAAGQLFFVALFVLTGANLEFGGFGAVALAAMAFVVVRFLAKGLALIVFAPLSGLRPGGGGLVALALLPMSGLSVTMLQDTAALYAGFGAELASVVLPAIAILELLGPLATQYALQRANESHPETQDK